MESPAAGPRGTSHQQQRQHHEQQRHDQRRRDAAAFSKLARNLTAADAGYNLHDILADIPSPPSCVESDTSTRRDRSDRRKPRHTTYFDELAVALRGSVKFSV
jgi:hypothetical protein